jgi:ADP-ribose pyrophosphatase
MSAHLSPWRTVERTSLFSAGPITEIAREKVLLPDGRIVPDYYTVTMGDYALVYAVTTQGKVLILRQYKHGCRRVCLTFPGGYVAPGEDPAVAAERELLEETGYRLNTMIPLGAFIVNANQGCNTAHLFRADGCWYEKPPQSGDLEEMELLEMGRDELMAPSSIADMAALAYVTLALLADRVKPGN